MKIFLYLIVLFSLNNCSREHVIDLKNEEVQYFYCAFFEEGGLRFNPVNKIKSTEDFIWQKSQLKKIYPNRDAYYYKVVRSDKKIIVYGYSMTTNEIKEIMKSDSLGKLIYKKTFENDKECIRKYLFKEKRLNVKETCDDDTLKDAYYLYDEKNKYYEHKVIKYYKGETFIKKAVYNSNGEVILYSAKGKVIEKRNFMGLSDFCVPFRLMQYRILKNKKR